MRSVHVNKLSVAGLGEEFKKKVTCFDVAIDAKGENQIHTIPADRPGCLQPDRYPGAATRAIRLHAKEISEIYSGGLPSIRKVPILVCITGERLPNELGTSSRGAVRKRQVDVDQKR